MRSFKLRNFRSGAALRLVKPSPVADACGENSAFIEALYSEYHSALGHYVARMLPGGREEAETILQETYIKLLRLQDLQPLRENPRAYLYTVATNLVRDSLRRQLRRRADQHESFDEQDHASSQVSPQGSAEWQQSLQQLKQSLLRLKPVTRKVFLLSRFEEMTYPEVAAALSISTRSVERHMSTALKHLQQELNELL
ncbi:sigma-70 family RNA polymerase sigma factor [Microbulbifer sp. SH-1]|uniref:RNA polymerase sigma factor n=1 Tax=Microbulbifer sp. SH-1 TaxID=2681547 RepID=UPI00140801D3|nr:RNA polymerase sigma factor [Microbulbifer sp. SH-1]QIL91684.1 sigma-70 family RNA polymerase sigma factor [Microbulbifer sp. SH-1]